MTDKVAWLSNPSLAMPAVIATTSGAACPSSRSCCWRGCRHRRRALRGGAGGRRGVLERFWHITLPMLRRSSWWPPPTRIIWTFNYADLIFVMTSGGPANATQITSTYTLLQAYSNLDFGYARRCRWSCC